MEGKVNYTVVGIFVVTLMMISFVIIFWMSTHGHTDKFNTYLVYVHEDVTGLTIESPVRFNGVQVGYVESIRLDDRNSRLVRLTLKIQHDVLITDSTYAMLNAQGITGVIYVNLKARTEQAQRLTTKPGESYPVIPSEPSLLMQLSNVLPEMTRDIQQLSVSVAKVFDIKNRRSISQSLDNIQVFTQTLANNSDHLAASLQSLNKTLDHFDKASEKLPELMKSTQETLSSIRKLSLHATTAADAVTSTANQGRVTIANFSNQILPNAEQMISHFNSVTATLEQFTEELQRNPSILVRGKQPEALGPGE